MPYAHGGMLIAASIWASALVTSALFSGITAITARALAVRVRVAALFIGPPLVRFGIASIPIHLNAVPLPLAYVAFEPTGDDPERTELDDASRARRVAIVLVPWIAIALLCCALLGPEPALHSIANGFVQAVAGPIMPASTGSSLVARLVSLAAHEPWHVFAARVATKLVAFNLLPLPSLAGFAFVWELLRPASRPAPPTSIRIAGQLIVVALAIGWIVAVVMHARGD